MADIEAAVDDGQRCLGGIGVREQRTGVAGGECAVADFGLYGRGEVHQPQCIGHMAAGFADGLAEGFLRETELVDHTAVALRLFDGVEVLSLEVLDEGRGHGFGFVEWADECGDFVQSGALGGPPAPFAGDDLIVTGSGGMGASEDGLQDAARANGFGQFFQSRRLHGSAGLVWTWLEEIDRDGGDVGVGRLGDFEAHFSEERCQAATETVRAVLGAHDTAFAYLRIR